MTDHASLAERLITELAPKSVLDAFGTSPELLDALGARGLDTVRAADGVERDWDLVLALGAPPLTHAQRRALVARIVAYGSDVILAPRGDEAGGLGVAASVSYWSELFAEHRFFLDADYDATFLAPRALRFRRVSAPVTSLSLEAEVEQLGRRLREREAAVARLRYRLLEQQRDVSSRIAAWMASGLRRLLRAESRRSPYWTLRRTLEVLLDDGLREVAGRTRVKLGLGVRGYGMLVRPPAEKRSDIDEQYFIWQAVHRLAADDMIALRGDAAALQYRPTISIVTPVYETEERLLRRTVDSVREQVYDAWELCLVDDGSRAPHVRRVLEEYAEADPRIRVDFRAENGGIVAASNRGLRMARGEFVGLLDHDDELTPDALLEVVKLLNRSPELDLVYTDEDMLQPDGRRIRPFFKPDWSPDLLRAMNYITHFSVFRRRLVAELGGFRPGYDGSQDYDLLLRFTERTARIGHVPKVLYHWRITPGSAAGSPAAKPFAYEAAQRALEDSRERQGWPGRVRRGTPGIYRTQYLVRGEPAVSIVIPARDGPELLEACVRSIEEKTRYQRYEIVVVGDAGTGTVADALSRLATRRPVHRLDGARTVAELHNAGAARASGEHLVFMSPAVQVLDGEWLTALLEHAQRPEVGAVGAKLLYPDGRIQHAGVVLGMAGPANHAFRHQPGDVGGHWILANVVRNCSAVTGACMMVPRRAFDGVGGFDLRFRVAYADVDLCLRLRQRGALVLYTPWAVLGHADPGRRAVLDLAHDEELCWRLWGDLIRRGDPYYNPNLTRASEDWSLDMPV
ncbi:MAG: glycosyltransferase family 2 protein [Candidatus Rokuibacteriota bacterium]